MVAWFKHDIPAWMDGTEALDAEPYRAYHVICQLIYLNEGPIALNEHGIAGRCKQSIRTFRAALRILLDLGKLTLSDGRLENSRAGKELENVSENRVNAAKGGKKSAEVRNSSPKPLENNTSDQATLQDDRSLKEKRREEETREEKKEEEALAPLALRDDGYTRSEPPIKIKAEPRVVVHSNREEPKKPRKKPKQSLPVDWKPSRHAYAVAAEEGESVEAVEKIFRSYLIRSGQLYVDHDEAFYHFIRNQKNFNRGSGNGFRSIEPKKSIIGAADRAIENLEREIAADNEARQGVVLSLPSKRL